MPRQSDMWDDASGVLTAVQVKELQDRIDAQLAPPAQAPDMLLANGSTVTFRDEVVRAETAARRQQVEHMLHYQPATRDLQALVDAGPSGPVWERATHPFWRNQRQYPAPTPFTPEASEALGRAMTEAHSRCEAVPAAPSTEPAPRRGLMISDIGAVSYPAVLREMRHTSGQWADSMFLRELERNAAPVDKADQAARLATHALNRHTIRVPEWLTDAVVAFLTQVGTSAPQLRFCRSRMVLERRDGTSRSVEESIQPMLPSAPRPIQPPLQYDGYRTTAPVLVDLQPGNAYRLGVVSLVDGAPIPVRNSTVGTRLREAARRLRESAIPTNRHAGVTTSGT